MCVVALAVLAGNLKLPKNLIALDSKEGQEIFQQSTYKADFWPLMENIETQQNLMYSGVASMVVALNALNVDPPTEPAHAPYKMYTQNNIFTPAVLKITTPTNVNKRGVNLTELEKMLGDYPVKALMYRTNDTSYKEFKESAMHALKTGKGYVIVNFDRRTMGEKGGGQFSPIAAYDATTNRFLIVDVARYMYPPVWVNGLDLWHAMKAVDTRTHEPRGFVIISKL